MFSENSLAMNAPLVFGEVISALHTGTIAFRCPLPMPLMSRSQSILLSGHEISYVPSSILCGTLKGGTDDHPDTPLLAR